MSGQSTPTSSLRDVTEIVADLSSETDVIVTLQLIKELHDWVAAAQTTVVGRAMTEGYTHRDIGEALGVSQQAISKRYGCGGNDEKKDGAEAKRTSASQLKALAHFTSNGDYVGYSLAIEVEGLPFGTAPFTQRPTGSAPPDASHEQSWVSDADAAVAQITSPVVGPQPSL